MARNTITTPRCPTLAEVTREVEQDPSNYFRDVDGTCHEPLWDLGHLAYNIHRDCRARFVAEVRSATQAGIALACGAALVWLTGKSLRIGMLRYGQRLRLRELFAGRVRA